MARYKNGKTETAEHKKARKANKADKRQSREANGKSFDRLLIRIPCLLHTSQTNAHYCHYRADPLKRPNVIVGTRTAQNQLSQARRFLAHEHEVDPLRFSHEAINQVQKLFHKEYVPSESSTLDS